VFPRADLVRRLAPGGVLVALVALLLHWPSVRGGIAPFVPGYVLVVFAAGLAAAVRFQRSAIAFSLAVLFLADRAALAFPGEAGPIVPAVALLLPLNLAAFAWLPDRGIISPSGRARLAVVTAESIAVALIALPAMRGLETALAQPLVPAAPARIVGLTHLAFVAFVIALGAVLTRVIRHGATMDCGALWALAGAWLALGIEIGLASTVYFATAGLVLVMALLESWYGLAYVDELTELPARRALTDALGRLPSRYTVAMVDIDHFKKFNDTHGHAVGDQLLKMVAAKLAAVTGGGRAFRYGGEEFAILFPGKSVSETLPHVEAVRKNIEASAFVLRGPDRPANRPETPRASRTRRVPLAVTVSIGVAGSERRKRPAPEDVVHAADAALYRAKGSGRNRVAI
jgi:diguanylate cyclase (GGDEF)-like protein